MPICRKCETQLPTVELRRAPKGPMCKDVTACAHRKSQRIEKARA